MGFANKKKFLFISNISNSINNVSIPSILAAQSLGYEFHYAADLSGFTDDPAKYNVTLHHIDLDRNPFNLKNIGAYKQMAALLEKEKFQALHCNTPIGGVLGRFCGKKIKVPNVLYTAHGFHFYKGSSFINSTVLKWAEMWMAHYTDAIITMNQEDYLSAQKFKLRSQGNVFYIPGVGVNTKDYQIEVTDTAALRQSLHLKENDTVLIAMGDLIKRKNYEASMRAIAQTNNDTLHFLICGRGPKLEELKRLAHELHVEKQIHFLGFRRDIKELLQIADIFLFTTYQEGLPRSTMEAMSAGLPCIVSRIRGNVDLIAEGKGGYLRSPNDFNGFAEVINYVAGQAELRKQMGRTNLETIKQFDVEHVKSVMKEIYSKVLGAGMR